MKRIVVFVVLSLLLLSACSTGSSNSDTQVYTVVSEAELSAGDAIPVPDEAIVTVTGNIKGANVGTSIQMDIDSLEAVGLVDYTVLDPFENKEITYRGPLMSDLLDLWGVPDSAETLHMVALNDYAVDVPIVDLREYPVVFALQADGEYLPVSTRGPAMLVYPYNDFDFEATIYNDYWIWQIKSIDIR